MKFLSVKCIYASFTSESILYAYSDKRALSFPPRDNQLKNLGVNCKFVFIILVFVLFFFRWEILDIIKKQLCYIN